MKTRYIALFAALLLAAPASADEKKVEKKAAKTVEVKAGKVTKVELKVPSKTEVKIVAPAEAKKVEPATPPVPAPKAATPAKVAKAEPPASQPVVPIIDPDDLGSILKQIVISAKTGKWALLVGFIVMLLTWLVNKVLKQKIPSNALPWIAIGLSTVATIAFSLATGGGWANALIIGLQHGLMAAGGWSAVGKYLPGVGSQPLHKMFGKPNGKAIETPAEPPPEQKVG